MAGLDRNKPFNQVVNDEEGRCYEQGGAYFTADGKPWASPDATPAPAKSSKKAATQLDAQLQEPA
jgi:uncharacterized Fe-S cluster protein YjdI